MQDEIVSQTALVDALSNAQGTANTATARLQQSMQALAAAEQQEAAAAQQAGAAASEAALKEDRRRQIVEQLTATLTRLREVQSIAAGAESSLRGSFLGAIGDLGAERALEGFESANQILQRRIQIWEQLGLSEERIRFLAAGYVDQIQDANRELGRTPAIVQSIDTAFESLKSKVAGVLTQALSVDVGVDPEDFLPRPDAVNEDARRLADVVVRGFESPWASYLQDKFPELFASALDASGGNVQQAAAQLLKDFQAGLRPEFMDRERAKEQVRRMLLGDANVAELAQEIASELSAEMGGQFSLAQIQQAAGQILGTGADSDAGAKMGEGFMTGITAKAAQLAEALDAKIREQYKALAESGNRAGAQWGSGFLATVGDNVPVALVNILVALTTPGVYARILQRQSQTAPVE